MFRTLASFLVLVLLAAASSAAPAGLQLQSAAGTDEALTLSSQVHVEVTGLVATVWLEQQFYNASGQWAEGRYRFPLPDGVAVDRLEIRIGERLVEGEIQPRQKAMQIYETAREQGQIAGLVEHESSNLFSTQIANIPPGELVEVRLGFSQPVEHEHGRMRLRFPTSSAPAFRPTAEALEALNLTPRARAALPARPINLRVDLRPGLALEEIQSFHHAVNVEQSGSDWLVELADGADFSGRDFELVWTPRDEGQAQLAVFAEAFGSQEHVMIDLLPPQSFVADNTPREVILIIDTSGSMYGQPMEQARESLKYALASLDEADRFNVIEFNHKVRSLYPSPRVFNQEHHLQALAWVDGLSASGGTEMEPPLMLALGTAPAAGYLRQILFITDGMISNERALVRRVVEEIGESRLFTVGIGHGVNSSFLARMAHSGRGSHVLIADTDHIIERMSDLILQLQSPVVHDLQLDWPQDAEVYPEQLPDLHVGQPLTVVARMDALQGDLVLTGLSNGRPFRQVVQLNQFQQAPGVASQWARARLDWLEEQRWVSYDHEQINDNIRDTALEYALVSSETSLVAVDRTPRRLMHEALAGHDLETSPAHGRAVSVAAFPSTDAGSLQALIRGLVALLLVGLLLAQRRIHGKEPQA